MERGVTGKNGRRSTRNGFGWRLELGGSVIIFLPNCNRAII